MEENRKFRNFIHEDWRNEFEKKRFDIDGNCFLCGRQEYLHAEPALKKCENNFHSFKPDSLSGE